MPRRIVVVDEIPKGATGKLQRIGLAERLGSRERRRAATPAAVRTASSSRELIEIWESVLDTRGLDVGDDFFALGGDSILGAEAVARVRDLVGDPDLPLISIVRAPTPAAMAQRGRLLRRARQLRRRSRSRSQGRGRRSSSSTPATASVLTYPALATPARRRSAELRPAREWARRRRGGDAVVAAEIAADYVTEVRQIQPHGPYVLGGFCVGGAIAVEMASQLQAAGEEIGLLVLLDPRFGRPRGLRADLWRITRAVRERRLMRAVGRKVQRTDAAGPSPVDVWSKLDDSRESFVPRRVDAPAAVFLSSEHERFGIPDWYLHSLVSAKRWEQLPCDHARLLLPPNVDVVAAGISQAIDAFAPAPSTV